MKCLHVRKDSINNDLKQCSKKFNAKRRYDTIVDFIIGLIEKYLKFRFLNSSYNNNNTSIQVV